MGLFDTAAQLRSTILIGVKMDIKDAKASAKELSGAQKKAMDESIAAMEKQEKALDRQIQMWSKWSVVVGVAGKAFGALKTSFEVFAQDAQLSAAAAGAEMDGLRKASMGLVTDLELLRFAASAQHAVMKLNNEQMQIAQQFMLVLRKEGNEYKQVQEEVTKALIEGKVEGLEKFGETLKMTGDRVQDATAIIEHMRKRVEEMKEPLSIAGDEVRRMGVEFENTKRKAQITFGRVMKPLLSELAREFNNLAEAAAGAADKISFALGGRTALGVAALRGFQAGEAVNRTRAAQAATAAIQADMDRKLAAAEANADRILKLAQDRLKTFEQRRGGTGRGPISVTDDLGRFELPRAGVPEAVAGGVGSLGFGGEDIFIPGKSGLLTLQDMPEIGLAPEKSFLHRMFGPKSEFLEYEKLLQGLAGAVGETYVAVVTGSSSASEAFQKALSTMVLGIGKQAAVNAAMETAHAIKDLAIGNFPGAAVHGKAAAAYVGVAALAGGVARGLGAGSSTAPTPNTIGTGGGIGNQSTTINYFGGFTDDDPPERRASQFKRLLDRARDGGDDTIVVAS